MSWPKLYQPQEAEPEIAERWEAEGVNRFDVESTAPIFSIDTPPPTVSGHLHGGHLYSYSHADFIARFQRMRGANVYYPMGFDDNGLPTERLVERRLGKPAREVGRREFVEKCLELSDEFEAEYKNLFRRMGLSVDWRYTYRTISETSRRESQLSFIDLFRKGLAYHDRAPTIWCPECRTAIAQAEVNDLERETEFVTINFDTDFGPIPIATTRPEMIPACVAIFVHPGDSRYAKFVGHTAVAPYTEQEVPILEDEAADPEKGTGAVQCCTFGDNTDIAWWRSHGLSLREEIGEDGRITGVGESLEGMTVPEARRQMIAWLEEQGRVTERRPISQTVRVHERCDTPVEFILTNQWFIRVLDQKETFLKIGDQVEWQPPQMQSRYREWIENLHWDWIISRQRFFGVHFPVWYCRDCGEVVVADEGDLPVDPLVDEPKKACDCGSTNLEPEGDVMDTWATSSLSPQLAGQRQADPDLYERVFPMSLRPQAHEIIRTWAFDTIVKSHYHWNVVPWKQTLISGWGLAPAGAGKISKSRGGGPLAPMDLVDRYGADAVRYWAASTGPGKDTIINEEKMQAGAKLVTKLWNVAGFSQRFLDGFSPPASPPEGLSPADRWMHDALNRVIEASTAFFEVSDYAGAKNDVETLFWSFTDNYLEMAKKRLYEGSGPGFEAARFTLHRALLSFLQLLAPIMPYVTDEIYQRLFTAEGDAASIHRSAWPRVDEALTFESGHLVGNALVAIATAVRRYKSDHEMSLGARIAELHLTLTDGKLEEELSRAAEDLMSVTRAESVSVGPTPNDLSPIEVPYGANASLSLALRRS